VVRHPLSVEQLSVAEAVLNRIITHAADKPSGRVRRSPQESRLFAWKLVFFALL